MNFVLRDYRQLHAHNRKKERAKGIFSERSTVVFVILVPGDQVTKYTALDRDCFLMMTAL